MLTYVLLDGSTIVHAEVPKMPPSSITKRGMAKLADGKAKEMLEPLLPHTVYQSSSMSSNAKAADIILAPSDFKGSESDSAFKSYPPRITLDEESNELGLFDGADMVGGIPSSSLNQDGYANMSISDNLSALTMPECEDTMPLQYMRLSQAATKNESSPYPDFECSPGVQGFRAGAASADVNMQLCDQDLLSFHNPHIGNAQVRNDLWNGVEGALSRLDYASHGRPSKQASFFNSRIDYACGSSTTSHPQDPSMGNTFSNPPVMEVQTTPQPLDATSVYGHSYCKTNLFNSTFDPRTLPLDDSLTLGSLVGDDQSRPSEPSRPSMLNVAVQQMSHYTGAPPVHVVCRPLHSCNYLLKRSR